MGLESLGAVLSTGAVAETEMGRSPSRRCEWFLLVSVVPTKMPMGILVG